VRVQFGPSFKKVEQARGISLNRVALERTPSSGDAKTPAAAGIEAVRRDGAQIAESAHVLTEQRGESAPSVVKVVRPAWIGAPAPEGFHKPKAHPAHADTARADSTH